MPEIKRLLIANRGEIASRIARSAHACGIETVAVYSDPDRSAPHVRDSAIAVHLPGSAPGETYLRGDRIVEAALRTGCDAVHPGYGFLSENADFARAVEAAGLTFVGPRPESIEAMGSKIRAKKMMKDSGVPVLPSIEVGGEDSGADLTEKVADLGLPVLVKASAGGGGRGMRIVHELAELADAVESARSEALSAFGDGTLFIERFVTSPRHIEIQIIGDEHGNLTHLFERECSIQRRYQKIVEEAPSPAVDDALRSRLCAAAVNAGRALAYRGAGTVEFVLDEGGEFYFLEINTRLQVEHPVTEAVTGIDLVREQLNVAAGRPLSENVLNAKLDGHAIEVRLYAEDPANDYLPASGELRDFSFPDGLRVDAGYAAGGKVATHYDAMLAKVIAHGETRDEAAALLAHGLELARVHGVPTNRDLLIGILREPDFLAGRLTTAYLTEHPVDKLIAPASDLAGALVAATVVWRSYRGRRRRVQREVSPRFRNVPAVAGTLSLVTPDGTSVIEYDDKPDQFVIDGNHVTVFSQALGVDQEGRHRIELVRDGILSRWLVRLDDLGVVDVDGPGCSLEFHVVDPLPMPASAEESGSLEAPMPGTVMRVLVEEGDLVEQNQPIVVLEAMKMEHSVRAPMAGRVSRLHARVGDQVDLGMALAVVEDAE